MAEITFKGGPVTLVGQEVKVGDQAPDFTVLTNSLEEKSLADMKGKVTIISVIPSIDTGVVMHKHAVLTKKLQSLEMSTSTQSVQTFHSRKRAGAALTELTKWKHCLTTEICHLAKRSVCILKNFVCLRVPYLSLMRTEKSFTLNM